MTNDIKPSYEELLAENERLKAELKFAENTVTEIEDADAVYLKAHNLALVGALKEIAEEGYSDYVKTNIAKEALSLSPSSSMEALREIVRALSTMKEDYEFMNKQIKHGTRIMELYFPLYAEEALATAEKVFGVKG